MTTNAMKGVFPAGRTKIVWLPVSDLLPHPRVQREAFDEKRVEKIADTFNPDKFGVIAVVRERGSYYVIDGKHRVAAVKRALGDNQQVPCEVFDDISLAEAADLFLGLNDSLGMRTIDKFMQRVLRGDEGPCAIVATLKQHGMGVGGGPTPGIVRATAACEAVYRKSPKLFADTVRILVGAYGKDDADAFHGNLIRGLGIALVQNPAIAQDGMVARLASVEPTVLIRRGELRRQSDGGAVANAIGAVIMAIYNKGRRNRGTVG